MAVLGHPSMFKAPIVLAYGTTGPKLFILPPFDGQEARPGNGVHAAFKVDSRVTVDALHFMRRPSPTAAPMKGPRASARTTTPNCYGAYVRDPDGNKIQAVCHRKDG